MPSTPSTPAWHPGASDYVDALQTPSLAFQDPMLQRGTVLCDRFGSPRPISGAFASVFHIDTPDGKSAAVKCFFRPPRDLGWRYQQIDAALRALHHEALVDFEYNPEGVLVRGHRFPLLRMGWIEGQQLASWLETNRTDAARIRHVADQFTAAVRSLEAAGIAHGDLQHANLLVTPDDRLKLIDYDGMFVPSLSGAPPTEKGLANYQSPARTDHDFGPDLDRFSAWVIYASLTALAHAPQLWWEVPNDGDDKLLFDATDYHDPQTSPARVALRSTGDPALAALAELIAAAAQLPDLSAVPPFDPTRYLSHRAAGSTRRPAQGRPSWMQEDIADATASPASPSPAAHADGEGVTGLPPVTFGVSPQAVNARLTVALTFMLLAAVGLAAGAGYIPVTAAALGALCVTATAAYTIRAFYRRHPQIIARRAAQAQLRDAQRDLGDVRKHQRILETERETITHDQQRALAQNQAARSDAERTRDAERNAAEAAIRQAIRRANAAIDAARASRNTQIEDALETLRNDHIHRKLEAVPIASRIPARMPAVPRRRPRQARDAHLRRLPRIPGHRNRPGREDLSQMPRLSGGRLHPRDRPRACRRYARIRDEIRAAASATAPRQLPLERTRAIDSGIDALITQAKNTRAITEKAARARTATAAQQFAQQQVAFDRREAVIKMETAAGL